MNPAVTPEVLAALARKSRRQIVEMIARAGKGHIGGAFSCLDILTTLYHGGILRVDPQRPDWPERDWFLLSKGHACTSLYVTLAQRGFFPTSWLEAYGQPGCRLGGHPDRRIPGVEVDSGSLGHGLGLASGLALAAQMDHCQRLAVVVLGDGESCEGSLWEAAMFAASRPLGNLVAIVDSNGLCATDTLAHCVAMEPLLDKWRAFGWEAVAVDGHDHAALLALFSQLRQRKMNGPPLAVIARTVKGKGVSFMENQVAWHHKVPAGDKLAQARLELAD